MIVRNVNTSQLMNRYIKKIEESVSKKCYIQLIRFYQKHVITTFLCENCYNGIWFLKVPAYYVENLVEIDYCVLELRLKG